MKVLIVCVILLAASHLRAIDISASIVSSGVNRTFVIHAAGTAVAHNLPVIFVLHGDGGTAAGIKSYAGFDAQADNLGFMAVYPNSNQAGGIWNKYADAVPGDAGSGNTTAVDDVVFFDDLIDYLCTNYFIDRARVYATGHSGGAFMAYNMAVQLPNKIAAIAPVAGSLWGSNSWLASYFTAANYQPIAIYHVHGDADGAVAYPDPNHIANVWNEWPLNNFAFFNCGNNTYTSTTNIAATVQDKAFCSSAKKVSLIRVQGGGHGWPVAAGYNAANAIASFLLENSLANQPSCANVALSINTLELDAQILPDGQGISLNFWAEGGSSAYELLVSANTRGTWQKVTLFEPKSSNERQYWQYTYRFNTTDNELYFKVMNKNNRTESNIIRLDLKKEKTAYIYYNRAGGAFLHTTTGGQLYIYSLNGQSQSLQLPAGVFSLHNYQNGQQRLLSFVDTQNMVFRFKLAF
jgi:poly(3-hydroxybutyrate) depolymerase